MSRRTMVVAVLALVFAGGGLAAQTTGDPVLELLSGIDFVPGRATLDQAATGNAEPDLLELASGTSPGVDSGIRLRAIRALALYPSAEAASTLSALVQEESSKTDGLATLYVRAAMIALAEVDGAAAVSIIAPQLDHPVLDVRATAARALAQTDSPSAVPVLRERLGIEQSPQVRLALSSAIRVLTGVPIPE